MGRQREGVSIVVSWPEPGRVLPGLTSRLGADVAAELAEAFLDDFIETLRALPVDILLCALDHAGKFSKRYPRLEVRAAPSLHDTFRLLLMRHPRALVVTAPPPDLHPRLLWSAFEIMNQRDAVVGATDRGGVWLLGMRESRDVFRGVGTGKPGDLERLEGNLDRAGQDIGYFPSRRTMESLESLEGMVRRAGPDRAKRTRRRVRKLSRARASAHA